jgi:hypothetical protein
LIKVNNTEVQTPSSYQVSIEDIVKAERNAAGTMVIERIATKRKIELAWNFMTQSQLSTLLQMVSAVTFTVEYPDPQDGAMRLGTFYAGSKSAGAIDYRNDVIRWKDCKFNLIEL